MQPTTAPTPHHRGDDLPSDELNRRGIERFARGDFAGAASVFELATTLNHDFPQAWNNLGLVLQTLGRHSEAVAAFDGAIAARPEYAECFCNRGRCRQAIGGMRDARFDYDRAFACADQTLRPALHNRGTLRHRDGDLARAEEDFTAALDLAPDHLPTYLARAAVLKDAGDLAGASADLDYAIARLPSDQAAPAYHIRGG